MVVIYTRAYNAETTLRRTVESILSQTYIDFTYILFNNGSNDSTLEIMKEYARRDKRIIVLSSEINMKNFNSCKGILTFIANNFEDGDFLCNIDADDAYHPDFFGEMVCFMQENQLDTVCCGYNALDRDTGDLIECKKPERNLVVENEDLPHYFMTYRRYTTDMWAKLFKVSLLKYYFDKERFEVLKPLNHSQQNFIFDAFQNSSRVGFLSEALMDYYVSNTAQKNMRMWGDVSLLQARDIFRIMQNFLSHYKVSELIQLRNTSYLYAIYSGYIKDAIEVIKLNNSISISNKVNYFFDIFSYYITKNMLELKADDEFYSLRRESKEELCNGVISYILAQKGWEAYRIKVEKIVSYMRDCEISVSPLDTALL